MKKDSEYSGNFDKKSTPVIKIGVPTEFDLHRAQYHESGKTKQSKVESKSVPPPHVSHGEGFSKVESEPVAPPPVSHTKHFYRVCKEGVSHVTHTVLDGGRFVYRGGKVEINIPLVPKRSNPIKNKTFETPQQIVTAVPSFPPSSLILKDFVTPTTIASILVTVAIVRQPIEVFREITRQFSALYVIFKKIAPPASIRKLRQLVDADKFINNRATFTISDKNKKPRKANILIHKTTIFAPAQQLERGSIYIANKQIGKTPICRCVYGKVITTTDSKSCELAFDLSVSPCFQFKPSSSLARWCYMSVDVAKRLDCDFTGLDELMRRGEL